MPTETTVKSIAFDSTKVSLPPGFRLVETPGGFTLERSDEKLTHTVAFRLTPSEYLDILPFFEVFSGGRGSEALRWLLQQDEVRDVISRRVRQSNAGLLP